MARIPTRGATTVTPHRTEAELGKVLSELCPDGNFSKSEISEIHLRLGAVIGRWSAQQDRLNTLEFNLPTVPSLGDERRFRESIQRIIRRSGFEYAMIDGTIVRVHQHGAGAKGGLKIRRSADRVAA